MDQAKISSDVNAAAAILRSGGLVAIPTETVYGLAANAFDPDAIVKIFEAKRRPFFDPLICHTDTLEKVKTFVDYIPEKAFELAKVFWPGPMTLILPKKHNIPDIVTSGLDTVGVRIPDHPMTLELLSKLDFPLAAPSANPFGYVSPTTAQHVADQLGDDVDMILDGGPCSVGVESTIIGFEEDDIVVYRLGGLSIESIEKVVGNVQLSVNESSNPVAPGQLKSHYAPLKPLLVGDVMSLIKQHPGKKAGIISFYKSYDGVAKQIILSPAKNLNEAATKLFAAIRELDKADVEIIFAEVFPDEGLGRAINDRLKRASV